MLFLSTIINYLDRQTLSLLAPFLKLDYHWTNTDYANILIGFRVGYSLGQTVLGRMIDRIGTRRGLSITVAMYSLVASATSLARGFHSFATFRTLLGTAGSANWPGAARRSPNGSQNASVRLPPRYSIVGRRSAAPSLLSGAWDLLRWGWRLSFVIPGLLGFLWLILWRKMYYPPQDHPRISPEELQMIQSTLWRKRKTAVTSLSPGMFCSNCPRPGERSSPRRSPIPCGSLSLTGFRFTWLQKAFLLRAESRRLGSIHRRRPGKLFWWRCVWVPGEAGLVAGRGAKSARDLRRNWRPVVDSNSSDQQSLLDHSAFCTLHVFLRFVFHHRKLLPSDLFFSRSVATVAGLSGTGAGIGTIIAFKLIGYFSDMPHVAAGHSFDRSLIVAGIVPFVGMLLVLLLVRNTRATREGLVRPI